MDVPDSVPAPGGHASAGAAASRGGASKHRIPPHSVSEEDVSEDSVSEDGASQENASNGGGRIAWKLLALAVLLPVVSVSVFRAVPAPWPTPVVQLLAFTPWLVVPAILALGLTVAGRRGWLTALAAAVLAAQLFWLFPLDAGRPSPDSPVAGTRITVLSINSQFGQADAAETVRIIREHGVDLLAVQEHTQDLEDRLAAQGLQRLLPHIFSDPRDDASGSAIYSAHPMEAVGVLPDTRFPMPTVRLTIRQRDRASVLEVTNVHAFPPVAGRAAQWRSDLAALERLAATGTRDTPGQSNRLLSGDFNATFDHAEFRAVLDGGGVLDAGSTGPDGGGGGKLVDVGSAAGLRLLPTWPMEGPPLPGIAIDHLVTSPLIASSGYAVHRVPGTDHAAVLATLEIPPAG
ncbi:endonuclease/exonuclease/phosphatase family protein [Arthrobacter sp. D1-17]